MFLLQLSSDTLPAHPHPELLESQLKTLNVPQYKFIVDGEWKYAPDQPAMHDERDIINNVVEVQEYVPDHLDSLVGFEPPPSPVERCPAAACCNVQSDLTSTCPITWTAWSALSSRPP